MRCDVPTCGTVGNSVRRYATKTSDVDHRLYISKSSEFTSSNEVHRRLCVVTHSTFYKSYSLLICEAI